MKAQPVKLIMFALIFALGVANIVVTFANGGGFSSVGFMIGALLCVLAAARFWLSYKGIG
jgi:hypothetical protein